MRKRRRTHSFVRLYVLMSAVLLLVTSIGTAQNSLKDDPVATGMEQIGD